MAKLARLLNLTAALQETSVPLTAEEIRTRVNGYPASDLAFHRAFERDKDDLRELGIPVETVALTHHATPKTGYTIDQRRSSQPDPGFSREELAALQLARAAVMFEGLEADEVEDTFRKLGGVEATASIGGPVGSIPLPEELAQIFEAISEHRLLEFHYGESLRSVEPIALHFDRGRWYLRAYDRTREGIRNFRTDRISGTVTRSAEGSFEPRDGDNQLITSPWATGSDEPIVVRIALDKEPAQATLLEYPDLVVIERNTDASVVVEATVRNAEGLFGFMAGLLERAEILTPPAIRQGYVDWLGHRVTGSEQTQEAR